MVLLIYMVRFFGSNIDRNKLKDKRNLVFNIALSGKAVVGFKMGYELDEYTFYSWLGGVDSSYRSEGIAPKLMDQQHQYLRDRGYKVVQTKTMNRWRSMLILNIKNGFDIIGMYIDENGRHKIVLEKNLFNERSHFVEEDGHD